MKNINKYISIFCISMAIFGFSLLSLGGEYLHAMVHDHDDHQVESTHCDHHEENHSDDGASEDCPIFKLLVQSFIDFSSDLYILPTNAHFAVYAVIQVYPYKTTIDLPSLRAPPII